MKKLFGLVPLFAALGLVFALSLFSCSNGSDGGDGNETTPVVVVVPGGPQNGGGGPATPTPEPTPAPATYTITLNANDGSVSPATATQTFTAGTPQNLKTIASLGFNKEGFNFAGWLTTADGVEACYADGAAYTAAADATLYAKWSAIPVYSATPSANARGTVTATPATAIAGTEITLSATPFDGYEFVSYTVTDADSNVVSVTDGKFTMPAKNVTVTATFNAINYSVTVEQPQKGGSVGASADTATVGTEVALLASVGAGYEFVSYAVTAADGSPVPVSNGKFTMPAKNVKVTATFKALNFTVTFNANDGSQSPAMETQAFEAEVPQALKAIVELGFSKNGFTFAGWAKSPDAEQAAYADGAFYKGTLSVTLYAVWSAIPVYSASAEECQNGSVAASPASAIAGTEITLTATPSAGYKLASYTVTGVDGSSVTVLNGKFTMPDKNVKVLANFGAIDYSVSVLSAQNGSVTANKTTAHINDVITLTTEPSAGYELDSYTVTGADSNPVPVANGKFKMPAGDVKVAAAFKAISYRVNVGTVANGTVTANKSSACVGDQITLNATANDGYKFDSYTVTDSDSNVVSVTNGKFTMPAKAVTVTANFSAIDYSVSVLSAQNGSVTANKTTATIGTVVTLTIEPASGYELSELTVTADGGTSVAISGTGNTRTIVMPASNVTVTASFKEISYSVNVGTAANGSVTADKTIARAGDTVTLTLAPDSGYMLKAVTVKDSNGATVSVSGTGNERTFTMPINDVAVTALFVARDKPLTVEAVETSVTVKFTNRASGPVTYRVNGGATRKISRNATGSISLGNVGDKVEFWGDNETYNPDGKEGVALSFNKTCYVYGNIMSLIDSENFDAAYELTGDYAFCYFFNSQEKMINKEGDDLKLPATTLSKECYKYMFRNCKSLTYAPELPATTLAEGCYRSMFSGCSGLASAPALPATTLAKSCYSSMFYNCRFTSAPALPATTLAESCYQYMFSDCSSLASAPALPATTLAESCYSRMFAGCSGLTSAPALPATTLAESCYSYMFSGCSSLASAPKLPATTLAKSCYSYMFQDCSSLASAPELPVTTLAESCYSYMFKGCSGLTSAPELPATTLAKSCYSYMFSGCSGLTSAPELPVTTLAESCYSNMFSSCRFTSAPALPATTLAKSCYAGMFASCSLKSAPELPATELAEYCYASMFSWCVSLIKAPVLPAETLAKGCYANMFQYCKKLERTPGLFAKKLVERCYSQMFLGCNHLWEVTCLADDFSAENCTYEWLKDVSSDGYFYTQSSRYDWSQGASGIPENWDVKH